MNKKILIITLVLLAVLTASSALAAEGVKINATNFPDAAFRSFVTTEYDKDKNGTLSQKEVDWVDLMNVTGKGIKNLTGIAHFPNLKSLYCGQNALTALDVSKNAKLEQLYCHDNKIKTFDLSENTALTHFTCDGNPVTKLDLTKNTALTALSCSDTALKALDLSKNTKLTYVNCPRGKLTKLVLSKNTKLTYVNCGSNALEKLTLNAPKLEELYCEYNKLAALDVTGSPALKTLYCQSNLLTELDLSKSAALVSLSCQGNQLTKLDVTQCKPLTLLYCKDNQLTSLKTGTNAKIKFLHCSNNHLTSLDLTKCADLTELQCVNNRLKVTTSNGKIPYADLPGFKAAKASVIEGAVGDGRDTTGVAVSAAVEDDVGDAGSLRALGDELADLAGLGGLVTVEEVRIHLLEEHGLGTVIRPAVHHARLRAGEVQFAHRPGDPDVAEPPLLLEPARFVEGRRAREDAVLHARHEDHWELQPLGAVERHEDHFVPGPVEVVVAGPQGDLREELPELALLRHGEAVLG